MFPPARLLALALFLSGAAALVLQGVWARWLAFALGAGAYGTTAVLATFMAGLGLGAVAGGRIASRVGAARGLRWLAIVELSNAAWAAGSVAWLPAAFPEAVAGIARALGSEGLPAGARIAFACVALIVPTVLMGATLPLAVRALAEGAADRGASPGLLYAVNTMGGAVGALLGATWLVDRVGLSGAAFAAASLQLAAAAVAFRLSRRAAAKAPLPLRSAGRGRPALAAAGFAAGGFAGLVLEVASQRILALQLGSTVEAFALMLACLLFGIAAGGALGALASRRARPESALAVALAALGASIGWAILLLDRGAGAPVVLLPAGLALGAIAGAVGRLAGASPASVSSGFAFASAANALASAAGVLVTALVLVPALGAAGALRVACGVALAASALVLLRTVRSGSATRLACAALAIGAIVASIGRDPVRTTYARWFGAKHLVAIEEGPVQAVAVTAESSDQHLDYRRLVAHRTSLAATHLAAQRYMRLLGHLPTILADAPRRALVICLGTGTTVAAVTAHRELERIDVAEISPEVVALVGRVHPAGAAALADPRVNLRVEDGRHILLASADRWDVITLEPPPPGDAGVVSLYTEEFYALCRSRLSEGGVVAQWIPLQSASVEDVRMLIGAFVRSFPHAAGFLPLERDLVLVGSALPLKRPLSLWREAIEAPDVAASMREIGFGDAVSLLAAAVADREALLRFSAGAPPLTDDRPRVERRGRDRLAALPDVRALRQSPDPTVALLGRPDPEVREARRSLELLRAAEDARERGDARRATSLREAAYLSRPQDPYFRWAARVSEAHLARFLADAERRGEDPRAWASVGEKLRLSGDEAGARAAFTRALRAMSSEDPAAASIRAWLRQRGAEPV